MERRPFLETVVSGSLGLLVAHCSFPFLRDDHPFPYSSGNKQKVLLLGIDGVRPDALSVARTPHLDNLIAHGCYSDAAQAGEHTVSAPGWSNIFCGVWERKHGVTNNTFSGSKYDQYPSLFTRLEQLHPELYTVSLVSWRPINDHIIPAADFRLSYSNDRDGDRQVTEQTIQVLSREDPDVMFVYFGNVDMVGHKYGFHPSVAPYVREIESVDRQIGLVLRTLQHRRQYASENWLILCTTDHGGTKSGHGQNIPEHRTGFYIVSGSSAQSGRLTGQPQQVDVVPTILTHLKIPLDPAWGLDGKVCGLR
ncbi:alkaline phosphatase family protein [Candidatus Woesearchaeota archaeon]|nr:alkaline phosphatase family protein [Candidatus Woesearchaeota archaeon]